MKKRFVYMTTNKITGKKYIGKHTTNDLNDGYFGSNDELIEDIKLLGKEHFERIILDYAETDEELKQKESYHLRKNKVVERSDFYNNTYAASGGNPFKNWTQERYEKYIELQRKVQTGKKRSRITRERISKNNVGFRGKRHTEETKRKISESMKGKTHSEETRKKLSKSSSKGKVYCYFNGELKYIFNSSAEAARKFIELNYIRTDKAFYKALKNEGKVMKGKLKGWEVIRVDKNSEVGA